MRISRTFTANGSRVLFPGWLALDTRARGEDVELPKVAEGERSRSSRSPRGEADRAAEPLHRSRAHQGAREARHRPPFDLRLIMKTIQDRGYVEKQGRTLVPTATGMVVSGWLEEHFADYISDTFTAEMEDELDEIARGERGYERRSRVLWPV
jgi:DNA topoisomerase-1